MIVEHYLHECSHSRVRPSTLMLSISLTAYSISTRLNLLLDFMCSACRCHYMQASEPTTHPVGLDTATMLIIQYCVLTRTQQEFPVPKFMIGFLEALPLFSPILFFSFPLLQSSPRLMPRPMSQFYALVELLKPLQINTTSFPKREGKRYRNS